MNECKTEVFIQFHIIFDLKKNSNTWAVVWKLESFHVGPKIFNLCVQKTWTHIMKIPGRQAHKSMKLQLLDKP